MGLESILYDRAFLNRYNPLSSVYKDQLPNNIKEVFKWSEFILANVPLVASALEKLSIVAITSIQYKTSDMTEINDIDVDSWKTIMEDDIGIIKVAQDIAFEFLFYGNVFLSVNTPIHRVMHCKLCGQNSNEDDFNGIEIKPLLDKDEKNRERLIFKGVCPKCGKNSEFSAKDTIIKDSEKINIVRWSPANIEFIKDKITGRAVYYYKLDGGTTQLIEKGTKIFLFNLPINTIMAALKKTSIKFNDDQILHIARRPMHGTGTSWGMPILTPVIAGMISLLLARKANEKIFSDMIFPLRALSPSAKGVDGQSIYNYMTSNDLQKKIQSILNSYKNDPTGVKFFPVPLNAQTVFGEGKTLNLTEEIRAMSEDIVTAIGVPIEFVRGGLSYTGAGASLRILENQLKNLTMSVEKAMNFISDKVAAILGKKPVKMNLIPFKLIDDVQDKQIALQMYQAGKLSDHTMASMLNIDSAIEADRIVEEQKQAVRQQMELQRYQRELSQNLQEKAETEAMLAQSSTKQVNQQAIMQEADGIAQQLMQLPEGEKRSQLDKLQKEDWLLYAAVRERLEFNQQKATTQAKYEAQQQGQ